MAPIVETCMSLGLKTGMIMSLVEGKVVVSKPGIRDRLWGLSDWVWECIDQMANRRFDDKFIGYWG